MSTRRLTPALFACLSALLLGGASGCSSMTLTGFDVPAIPINRIPSQYLARPKADMQELSFTRLRQDPAQVYQLGPGDVLLLHVPGIYPEVRAEGEVQKVEQERIVYQVDVDVPPAEGVPVAIREDGTLALREVDPINATGLTLEQLAEVIRRTYFDAEILKEGNDRVLVNLYSRRQYRVMVIREDIGSGGAASAGKGGVVVNSGSKRGSGTTVKLRAYENDVLHALTETGGLPGLDAANEILIIRGGFDDGLCYDQIVAQIRNCRQPCECPPKAPLPPNVLRIPLRFYSDQVPLFTQDDIILEEGDVVYIPGRETEKFYTGGVMPGGEHLLPRDYDLDVLGAVALAGGPVGSGGSGLSSIGQGGGAGRNNGRGGPGANPSDLIVIRKLPCGGQLPIRVDLNRALVDPSQRLIVQPGDTLILRYTICEELYNAALSLLQFNYILGRGNF